MERWHIISKKRWMFIIFILIYISFSFEIVIRPFVFAEDTIFLNDALTYGIKSIFYRHAGYLEVISRLAAIISIGIGKIFNSYWIVTAGMRLISITLASYFLSYFYLEDFSWLIKKIEVRFLISVVMLVWMANFYNFLYNITCMHWYEAVFVFWVGLNCVKGKFPRKGDRILCILCCLDAPESCMVVIPFLIFILINIKRQMKVKRYCYITFFIVFGCSIIQLLCLLNSENNGMLGGGLSLHSIIILIERTVLLTLETTTYIFSNAIVSLISLKIRLLLGLVLWIFLFIVTKKQQQGRVLFFYLIFFVAAHYFICTVKYNLLFRGRDYWEFSTPATVTVASIFIMSYILYISNGNVGSKLKRIILIMFLVFITSEFSHVGKIDGLGETYKNYDYDMLGVNQLYELENRVDFSADNYEEVVLYAGWILKIPVELR